MEWRFIDSGYADAYTNMAIDEAIMKRCQEGNENPVLRLYGWNPPAVSMGYFQKYEEAVNASACKSLGIDVVRRLTGGRAVLHEHEVTYSVIVREDYPGMPQSVVESYRFICRGIVEGLKLLGIEAAMETGRRKEIQPGSAACFDSASMYEITYRGKKLVGSAQVRKNGVILQHGSILIDFDAGRNADVMIEDAEAKAKLERVLANKVTSIKQILGYVPERVSILKAIYEGFEKGLSVNGINEDIMTTKSSAYYNAIYDKYKSDEWLRLK